MIRRHGLPTNVVTLEPASVAEKRPAESGIAADETKLPLADVTHGVT